MNQTKNVDHLKNQLTLSLQPTSGAVRNIYTPANGTLVSDVRNFIMLNMKKLLNSKIIFEFKLYLFS